MFHETWESVDSTCNLNKMIAELCFYRTLNFVDCWAKHNRVKLLNHLAWIEGSKITAPFSGRTGRVFLSECREICAICYLLLKLCTEFLILNQYVSLNRTWPFLVSFIDSLVIPRLFAKRINCGVIWEGSIWNPYIKPNRSLSSELNMWVLFNPFF